jgi:chromosome segregation ATPase
MADLDVKAELARVEGELRELSSRLQELDGQRQEVVNRIVGLQAVHGYLLRLDQHHDDKADGPRGR